MAVWYVWWHCGVREAAAWKLHQQQQQQQQGEEPREVTEGELEAAVAAAYADPEAR
jgi:hypothetical protein